MDGWTARRSSKGSARAWLTTVTSSLCLDRLKSRTPVPHDMTSRWRHPRKSLGWYREMKQTFADLPED